MHEYLFDIKSNEELIKMMPGIDKEKESNNVINYIESLYNTELHPELLEEKVAAIPELNYIFTLNDISKIIESFCSLKKQKKDLNMNLNLYTEISLELDISLENKINIIKTKLERLEANWQNIINDYQYAIKKANTVNRILYLKKLVDKILIKENPIKTCILQHNHETNTEI